MKNRNGIPVVRPKTGKSGFVRLELFTVVAVLLLIVLVMSPALASNRTDSERLVCFNNLRLIGRAVQMWSGDHDGHPHWRTYVSDGGLRPNSGTRAGNAWVDFYFLTNQLVTPTILACPSDVGVKKAMSFGDFVSISYRALAVSYVVGLDSLGDSPRSWVSGDRNINFGAGAGCSAQVNNINSIDAGGNNLSNYRWTNAVHGEFGHILLMDGSVEFASTPRLRTILRPQTDDNGGLHFLKAR